LQTAGRHLMYSMPSLQLAYASFEHFALVLLQASK
jgi:hypothetical protein